MIKLKGAPYYQFTELGKFGRNYTYFLFSFNGHKFMTKYINMKQIIE